MIARPDEALHHDVLAHLGRQFGQGFCLARRRREIERTVEANRLRNSLRDQRFDRRDSDHRKHGAGVDEARPDMPVGEAVGGNSHRYAPVP